MNSSYIFICTFLLCLTAFGQNSTTKSNDLGEDTIKTQKAQLNYVNTSRIDDLLDKKKRMNPNSVNVYRIQIYSGNRNGSIIEKERFEKFYPNITVETSYEQPYFKTKVDVFRSRLDAERTLKVYQKHFKNAFIFQENLSIDKLQ